MPNTPIIWLLLIVLCAVGSFVHPLWGLAGYLLEYYQRPAVQWWGHYLPELRWNFIIASILALSFLLRRGALPPVREVRNTAGLLLLLLCVNILLVNIWAVSPEMSWFWSERYWKTVVVYFLIVGIIRTPLALDLFLMLNMAGAAWWGIDALDKRRTSSRLEGIGSTDTLNSNLLAAHLLTILPSLVIFAWAERNWPRRVVALVCLPLVVNLFVLANSRGATVGFLAAALSAFVLVRFKQRTKVLVAVVVVGAVLYALADPQFIARQQTTAAVNDGSAQSRLELWRASLQLINDYPLGAGGRGFHILSPQYAPMTMAEDSDMGRSAHNTYIQAAAEWGVQGLILFVGFLALTLVYLHRVRRESTTPDWYYYRSLAVELGLVGTLVAGIFSVRFYGESIYWFSALAVALWRMDRSRYPQLPTGSPQ